MQHLPCFMPNASGAAWPTCTCACASAIAQGCGMHTNHLPQVPRLVSLKVSTPSSCACAVSDVAVVGPDDDLGVFQMLKRVQRQNIWGNGQCCVHTNNTGGKSSERHSGHPKHGRNRVVSIKRSLMLVGMVGWRMHARACVYAGVHRAACVDCLRCAARCAGCPLPL